MNISKNNRNYLLTYASCITDDDNYKTFSEVVLMPKETKERLRANCKVPFYRFIKADGQELFVCYDCLLYIEEKY